MPRHINIPIFIPHLGCPNQCVFCNQRHISGVAQFDPDSVTGIIEEALSTVDTDDEVEIAFFGGSFTGIDRDLMIKLLEVAGQYRKSGKISSIRCSTRPDYIDEEILDILMRSGVRVIELGLQSADDSVLCATKRGHSFEAERKACKMIIDRGFELVGQMMIGLPSATPESEIETAKFIVESGAHAARIYPTVVFKDTELCDMATRGTYTPITIEEAVERSVGPLEIFISAGVDVIRIGLCSSENLASEDTYFAGPNHPALGEMIINRLYYKKIYDKIKDCHSLPEVLTVYVAPGALSKAVGQKKTNKIRLIKELGLADAIFREDSSLRGYELKLEF